MDNKINEAIDKAIANLNVDDLKLTKEQMEELIKRLSENKDFIDKLNQEDNNNGKSNR